MVTCSDNLRGDKEMRRRGDDRRATPDADTASESSEFEFRFRLSDEAKSRMTEVEQRTSRVFATAARFAFR
jgi:RNA polymerase-binding transcription factor DksA